MPSTANAPDVGAGFYTAGEAARLLGFNSSQRVVRWLTTSAKGEPIVLRDYARIGGHHEVSFLDLIELKFISHFRGRGISLQALRIAAKNARQELGVEHPFATSSVKFQSDRRAVFLETAKEAGDKQLLDLMTKQIAIYDVLEGLFAKDMEFDVDGLARSWRPEPAIAPQVIVAPVFGFGRPVVSERRLPTATLFDAWIANGNDAEEVADWFDIDPASVTEAVAFELRPLH